MTAEEVQAYLRTSRATLDRWAAAGRLPYFQATPGAPRRFRRQDVDAFIASNLSNVTPEDDLQTFIRGQVGL